MKYNPPDRWKRVDGSTIACKESVKVLNENWQEISDELQNFYEDAVLMGCSKAFFKQAMKQLIDDLECDYKEICNTNPKDKA